MGKLVTQFIFALVRVRYYVVVFRRHGVAAVGGVTGGSVLTCFTDASITYRDCLTTTPATYSILT
jgi:hypothetical protein